MDSDDKKEILMVPVEDIIPNRFQPRLEFGEKDLQDLANSIREHGIIQPLILRKLGDKFEIIAGERRYKAATIVGLSKVPAVIVETDDKESAQMAIVENVQRKDLTSIEEAKSYQKLQEKGMTQEEIAKKIGVSQSAVANKLRLLSLDQSVKDALLKNQISERHARCLLSLIDNNDLQKQLLNKIIKEKLTVKQTEDELNIMLGKVFINPKEINPQMQKKEEDIPDFGKLFGTVLPSTSENQNNISNFNSIIEPVKPEIENDNKVSETIEDNKILETESSNYNINPFQEENEESEQKTVILDNPIENFSEYVDNKNQNSIINEFMEQQQNNNNEVTIAPEDIKEKSLSSAINNTRNFTRDLENSGYNVSTEEFDFEDMYQIVIKIKKD